MLATFLTDLEIAGLPRFTALGFIALCVQMLLVFC